MTNLKRKTLFVFGIINFILFNLFTTASLSQEQKIIAIVPPFMDRLNDEESTSMLALTQQRFIIFLYRNAAVVYSEADFMNTEIDSMAIELALPSTGYNEKENATSNFVSNGILSVLLWIDGERCAPEVLQEGDAEWYVIDAKFQPSRITKVKSLFWVQTSLTDVDSIPGLDTAKIIDGKRGFTINLSQAAVWRDNIGSLEVDVVFKEGLTATDTLDANPDTYEVEDSTISWSMRNIEPSTDDNISFYYNSAVKRKSKFNTMKKLSRFIVSRGYDEILNYVRKLEED